MSHFAVPVGDELSQIGEQTGQKVDSAMVSRGMRTAKDKMASAFLIATSFLQADRLLVSFHAWPQSEVLMLVLTLSRKVTTKTKTKQRRKPGRGRP